MASPFIIRIGIPTDWGRHTIGESADTPSVDMLTVHTVQRAAPRGITPLPEHTIAPPAWPDPTARAPWRKDTIHAPARPTPHDKATALMPRGERQPRRAAINGSRLGMSRPRTARWWVGAGPMAP